MDGIIGCKKLSTKASHTADLAQDCGAILAEGPALEGNLARADLNGVDSEGCFERATPPACASMQLQPGGSSACRQSVTKDGRLLHQEIDYNYTKTDVLEEGCCTAAVQPIKVAVEDTSEHRSSNTGNQKVNKLPCGTAGCSRPTDVGLSLVDRSSCELDRITCRESDDKRLTLQITNDVAAENIVAAEASALRVLPTPIGEDVEKGDLLSNAGDTNDNSLHKEGLLRNKHKDFVEAVQDALRQVVVPRAAGTASPSALGILNDSSTRNTTLVPLDGRSDRLRPATSPTRELVVQTLPVTGGCDEQASTTIGDGREQAHSDGSDDEGVLEVGGKGLSGGMVTEAAVTTTSTSPLLSRPPTPTVPTVTTYGECWVRYLSPDGYPYLYNAETGSSKWTVSAENEHDIDEQPNRHGTIVTGRTGEEVVDEGDTEKGANGNIDKAIGGETEGMSRDATERASVGTTTDDTISSMDMSDPDARYEGYHINTWCRGCC